MRSNVGEQETSFAAPAPAERLAEDGWDCDLDTLDTLSGDLERKGRQWECAFDRHVENVSQNDGGGDAARTRADKAGASCRAHRLQILRLLQVRLI